jgi:hypothetical protein
VGVSRKSTLCEKQEQPIATAQHRVAPERMLQDTQRPISPCLALGSMLTLSLSAA